MNRKNNRYCEMVESLHMPKEQYKQLKSELLEQYQEKPVKATKTVWKRYATAAVLALCLLGVSGTAYAAYHYQWFSMFFSNKEESQSILSKMAEKTSKTQLTEKSRDYRWTILNNLYSSKQQMGLLLCSLRFDKTDTGFLEVRDLSGDTKEKKNVYLTADGVQDIDTLPKGEFLDFRLANVQGEELSDVTQVYFSGEKAEDGGYLLGIRYMLGEENAVSSDLCIHLVAEQGDKEPVKKVLQMKLPEGEGMDSVTFTSKEAPESSIVVSAIGMTIHMQTLKDSDMDQGFAWEGEILYDTSLYYGNKGKRCKDITNAYTIILVEKEDATTNTWFVNQPFDELLEIEKITSIDLAGVKFEK